MKYENKPDDLVQETTTVGQVDIDIDAIFGTPGAENVMLPDNQEEPEKKSVFTVRDSKSFEKHCSSETINGDNK